MKKVKGFTLMELIVVMAIFGIIMFGALQLVNPVMKMMVQADVHEDGNAAVSSISRLLETELSSVEYLALNTKALSDTERTAAVNQFVDAYYSGVLASGSTTSSPKYATGKVHVMQIDNTNNGKVSTWVYDITCDPAGTTYITNPTSPAYTEYAINKAYYDSYSFVLKPGSYTTIDQFDNAVFKATPDTSNPDEYSMTDLLMSFTARETAFTIKATTNRNKTDYSFLTTSTMSLVNIYNRDRGPVTGVYYCVDKKDTNTELNHPPVWEDYIADRGAQNLMNHTMISSAIMNPPAGSNAESNNGYTFIYSYGAEINTQSP